MSSEFMYKMPVALVKEVTKGDTEYAWNVVLEHGHFQAQVVVLFETEAFVADTVWIGWLPGTGAVAGDSAPLPPQVELTHMNKPK